MFDIYLFTAIIFALFAAIVLLITLRIKNYNKTKSTQKERDDLQIKTKHKNLPDYSVLHRNEQHH